MNGVRSPAASKMWGDKKRQGMGGFKEEMSACLFQSHGETIRGKGNAVFCPCFSLISSWLILPTRWCLLCIRYGLYKNEKKIWQVNVVYHCGNSDQMALPSVDFLNPLPLCLFVLIFKLVEIPSSLSYAPINKKGVRCKDAEMRDIR